MIAVPSNVIVTPQGRPAVLEAIQNNWYEASRWSPHRSWIWYPVQDARRDLDRFTRYELVKHCRYLWKNSPLIRGLIERLVNLVVGSGIHPVPASSSPKWNLKAKTAWRRICRRPLVDSLMTMGQYQRVTARARFCDGEGFTLETYSLEDGRNRIQGLEADRITTAQTGLAQADDANQKNQEDGIWLNRQGRPIGYSVKGVKQPYSAADVVHHFTPVRSGQYRGEPILASAINTARDVDDILSLEKQAVKEASAHKDIIKTATGELDPETLRKLQYGTQFPTTLALPDDQKSRNDYYKVFFGGEPIVLKSGDEYTPYKPDRPGQAWQGFMDFLSQTICLSSGLPPSILLPVDVGGTDVRRDLEIAQRIIEPWQEDLALEWQDIWEYFIGAEIEDGPLMDAPDDWNEVRWHFPKSITVDRGRDAQNDRADVAVGLMSQGEYHGRYGDDSDEYEETIVAEVKRRRFRILGIPESEPFSSLKEYVQFLSLDSKTFANTGGQSEPAPTEPTDEPPGKPVRQAA